MVTRGGNIGVMFEIYRAAHPVDAHLLRGILEAEGIEAVVIGEYAFNVRGETPMTTETLPRVAVAKEEDVARAREIAASFDRREPLEGVELQEPETPDQ